MKALTVAFFIAIIAGFGFLAVQQQKANAELRAAIVRLEQQLRTIEQYAPARVSTTDTAGARPTAVVAAERTPTDHGDLARLREDLAALRASTDQLNRFAQQAQAAAALKNSDNIPTKLVAVSDFKNLGRATPQSAAETVIWAAAAGEVDSLAEAIAFTATARAKADAWFAGLSEPTRRQYGSPEKVAALMIAKDAAGLHGMQVLGQRELSPDEVGVRMRVADDQGRTKDDSWLMHRTASGWKLMLPEAALEKFARQLRPGGK